MTWAQVDLHVNAVVAKHYFYFYFCYGRSPNRPFRCLFNVYLYKPMSYKLLAKDHEQATLNKNIRLDYGYFTRDLIPTKDLMTERRGTNKHYISYIKFK